MKKLATKLSILALMASIGFSMSSCTTEDTGTGTTTTNSNIWLYPVTTAPVGLAANSQGTGGVGLRWARPIGDVGNDTVYVIQNSGTTASVVKTQIVPSTTNTAVVSGLTTGQNYYFRIGTSVGLSRDSIQWAPAVRSSLIRIYETADPNAGEPSGLQLSGTSNGVAQAISVGASSSVRQNADLVLASDNTVASHLSLVAGSVTSLSGLPAGKDTHLADPKSVPGGMDSVFYTGAFANLIASLNAFDVPNTNQANPVVIEGMSQDGHYFRLQVMPQANGLLYGGTPGANYIDVMVSYQTTANTAYASRPHPLMSNQPKHAGHID